MSGNSPSIGARSWRRKHELATQDGELETRDYRVCNDTESRAGRCLAFRLEAERGAQRRTAECDIAEKPVRALLVIEMAIQRANVPAPEAIARAENPLQRQVRVASADVEIV